MGKEFSSFIVYIENIENGVPKGWFMNPYMEKYEPFTDLGNMLLKMDTGLHRLMEKEKRGELNDSARCHSFQDFIFPVKARYFYLIQILYASHHSWQGLITGTNRPNITFKSALDCIRKMDEAMQRN